VCQRRRIVGSSFTYWRVRGHGGGGLVLEGDAVAAEAPVFVGAGMVAGARVCGIDIGDVEVVVVARELLGGGGRVNGDLEVAVVENAWSPHVWFW
jgi:hypothetical protein